MTPDERKAARKARQDAERAAHIVKVVAEAPIPTPEQMELLAQLLLPSLLKQAGLTARPPIATPHVPTEREKTLEKIAKLRGELAAARKRMDDALAGCHGCGLTREVHAYQKGYGGYHEWMPMSPDDMIKTVRAHKPKLAAIEKKIAELV